MANTSMDFWRMLWDENSAIIIMLNRLIENNRLKCHPYWPTGETDEDGETDIIFSSADFNVTFIEKDDYEFYAISQLCLLKNDSNEKRTVYHLHYYDWPDFGVPESPTKFLEFLKTVRSFYSSSPGPPIVHCSAGIGRTGTLVLVDTVLSIIEQKRTMNVDIYSILVYIRQHRFGLVQTPDQLRFCFLAILKGITVFDTSDFNEDRIIAELDLDPESSDGSVEYLDSDGSDFETEDEEFCGDEQENSDDVVDDDDDAVLGDDFVIDDEDEDDADHVLENDAAILLDDDGIIDECDIILDERNSTPDEEMVAHHIITEFHGALSEEFLRPPESPEQVSESPSPLDDPIRDSDSSPDIQMADESSEVNSNATEEITDRKAKTASIVSDIKERLKAHEEWVDRKHYMWNSFGKPLLFGSIAAVGLSIIVYLLR